MTKVAAQDARYKELAARLESMYVIQESEKLDVNAWDNVA